jgi:hypothetical protein
VLDGCDRLTFAQAQERAQRVAGALAATRPNGAAHVALFLRNQVEFMPVFLGAQLAGGVAVPLNPELRGPLLERMLAKCRARVLVARADLLDRGRARRVGRGRAGGGLRRRRRAGDHRRRAGRGARRLACRRPAARAGPAAKALGHGRAGVHLRNERRLESGGVVASLSSACVSDALGHGPDDVLSTALQMCHIAGLQNFANSALLWDVRRT